MIKTYLSNSSQLDFFVVGLRLAGADVRDCIHILGPLHGQGSSMHAILVRGQDRESITDSYIRTGAGVLDIDGGRVSMNLSDFKEIESKSSKNPQSIIKAIYGQYALARASKPHSKGRFPTNLILMHGPECTVDGTRQVKGSMVMKENQTSNGTGKVYAGAWKPGYVDGVTGYVDENGLEEIPKWICQPDCPIRLLDAQSGVLVSAKSRQAKPAYEGVSHTGFLRGETTPENQHGDKGGASRFFRQVQGSAQLKNYLRVLVRGA